MARKVITALMAILLLATGAVMAQEMMDGQVVPSTPDRLGVAQPGASDPAAPDGYGVANYFAAVIPATAFHAYNASLGYSFYSGGYIAPRSGDTFRYFLAPVYLPTGALLSSTIVTYYDNSGTGYVHVWFQKAECTAGSPCTETYLVDVQTTAADAPGYGSFNDSGTFGTTWRNYDQSGSTIDYGTIKVWFSEASSDLRVGPVMIWYQRQISPAPATATFPDVSTSYWAFQYIEALASSGITQGMPDGNFHPTDAVTRAQMATFLSRALGLDYPDYRP